MISVIIPTLNAGAGLPLTMACLVGAALEGLVKEVLVADGGSTDFTLEYADDAGARILKGHSVAAACASARGDWLLILQPGARLAPDWESAVARHVAADWERAGRFRTARRLAEALRLPLKGDEGLLISRRLYDQVGGGDGKALLKRLGGRIQRVDAVITV